ncbi:MAG: MFS transporter [Pararhodobacter sp.]
MIRVIPPLVVVLLLWGAGLAAAAQFGKFGVVFDLLSARYPGQSAAMIGGVISVVGLVGLVLGTTGGLFAARLGYRRILVAGLAAGAVISVLQALALPLPLLIASRVIEGLAHLAIVIAGPTLIAQVAPPRQQGLAMTLWSTFFGLSFAFMAYAGRPLAEAQGLGALLLAHGGVMALFAALLWAVLPPDPPASGQRLSLSALLRQHGAIYASPAVSAPALGFFCYALIYLALLTLIPPMIGGGHEMLIATGMPLVGIVVSLTLGVWMLRWISAVALVQGGFALSALGMVILWAGWGQPGPMLTGALMLATALGLVQGGSFAAIPQLNPDAGARAQAAGAMAQLGNLGTTSGTPLLALMIAGQGVHGVALFVLLPSLAGMGLHAWLSMRRRIHPQVF